MSKPTHRPTLYISTIGTSSLSNGVSSANRKAINRYANSSEADIPSDIRQNLGEWIVKAKSLLSDNATEETARKRSAELNCLIGVGAHRSTGNPPNHHVLLATDTWLGEEAMNCVSSWLSAQGQSVESRIVSDLNTSDFDSFRVALSELARELLNEIESWRAKGYQIIFNLSGGFKSINGFLQTLGMLAGDDTIYIFERSQNVMHIPRLPLTLNAELSITENLDLFRRMATGSTIEAAAAIEAGIAETLLFVVDGEASLSEWGQIAWAAARSSLLDRSDLSSLSNNLVVSEGFRRDLGKLTAEQRISANTRIDALCRLLDERAQGKRPMFNPDSLRFKKLVGEPAAARNQNFEHYAYLTDKPRAYGDFDKDGRYRLSHLGPHC